MLLGDTGGGRALPLIPGAVVAGPDQADDGRDERQDDPKGRFHAGSLFGGYAVGKTRISGSAVLAVR